MGHQSVTARVALEGQTVSACPDGTMMEEQSVPALVAL